MKTQLYKPREPYPSKCLAMLTGASAHKSQSHPPAQPHHRKADHLLAGRASQRDSVAFSSEQTPSPPPPQERALVTHQQPHATGSMALLAACPSSKVEINPSLWGTPRFQPEQPNACDCRTVEQTFQHTWKFVVTAIITNKRANR